MLLSVQSPVLSTDWCMLNLYFRSIQPFKMKKFVNVGARIPVSTHRRVKSNRRGQGASNDEGPPLEVGSPIGRAGEDDGEYSGEEAEPAGALDNAEIEAEV